MAENTNSETLVTRELRISMSARAARQFVAGSISDVPAAICRVRCAFGRSNAQRGGRGEECSLTSEYETADFRKVPRISDLAKSLSIFIDLRTQQVATARRKSLKRI